MIYNKILQTISSSASMMAGLGKLNSFFNLAIGSPDIPPPKELVDFLSTYPSRLNFNYMPSMASELARTNVLSIINNSFESDDLNKISLIPGAKYGVYNALKTVSNIGDRVLIIEPFWLSYPEIIKSLNLSYDSFYSDIQSLKFDFEGLKNKIIEYKPRILIINNPNNPLGSVFSNDELCTIIKFCSEKEIWVILDEVYKDLAYNYDYLHSCLYFDNLIRVGSFSKSLSIPGLRLGYVFGPKEFIKKFNLLDQHISTSINSLSHLVAENLHILNYSMHIGILKREYKQRFSFFSNKLTQRDYEVVNIESGFYCLIKSCKYANGSELKDYLLDKRILVTEGLAYGQSLKEYVRICLTLPLIELEKVILNFD